MADGSQQHADAKKSWRMQFVIGVLTIIIGGSATGLLGWIAMNTSENNATLRGMDQKLTGAVDELQRVDDEVESNENDIDQNEQKIRDNTEAIRRNQRDIKRLWGPHPRPQSPRDKQEGSR